MKTKNFVGGFLLGAALGILAAPKSGKEMRGDINKKYAEMKKDILTDFKNKKDAGYKKYQEVVDKMLASFEEAKKLTRKEATDLKESLMSNYKSMKKNISKEDKTSKDKN